MTMMIHHRSFVLRASEKFTVQKSLTEKRKTKLVVKLLWLNHCFALIFMCSFSLGMSHYLLKQRHHDNKQLNCSKNKLCKNCNLFSLISLVLCGLFMHQCLTQFHLLYAHVLFVKSVDVSPIDNKSIEMLKNYSPFPLLIQPFPIFPMEHNIVIIIYLYFKNHSENWITK